VIDKPGGITSHDVVARVRRLAGVKRVGHTGTLDPMATGVLVLCLGRATRLIPYLEEDRGGSAKEYEAEIRFGFETTTDDAEGAPRAEVRSVTLEETALRARLIDLSGEQDQVPPAFSAKKVAGERAYEIARRGDAPDLHAVTVRIDAAELLGFSDDRARIRLSCSRGTYVRSFARDLGRALGFGAHLTALRRTRTGRFVIGGALPLEGLTLEALSEALMPSAAVLSDWPSLSVDARHAGEIRQGKAIATQADRFPEPLRLRLLDQGGDLVALATVRTGSVQPFCVFPLTAV